MLWTHSSLGFFLSYMLGNLYAAQIYYAMLKEIKDFTYKIENNQFMAHKIY
ncbi:carboxypeptidase M32 [Thermosipho atlanticus]|uniref:carboxypeptidase M32 n=1 Tax=Thermosipho atlanticus TaxID=238991 RepID=UPI00118075E7